MIISGDVIKNQIKSGNWSSNFDFTNNNVNPNSVDVTLSDQMLINTRPAMITRDKNKFIPAVFEELEIIKNNGIFGFYLQPRSFYLGAVNEFIVADNPIVINKTLNWFAPMYETRSSIARCGIQTHLTAGFGDYGFKGRFTLEIVNLSCGAIFIEPGIRIGQIYFQSVYNNGKEPKKYESMYNDLQFKSCAPVLCKGEF